ncbi:endospore germination permease [Petroclostridium sp. X23]|uniref:GerAB/ArcD/ProY family transporter n=1 Tax=Petroclostridium sp. X23 TaxID=3045146 RepID=UPI0024ADB555|nr:endospore germination permease [Petroclostridium sp. X23]WHH61157.1 endospore germination permease [Petroclostridium sp. X23]
MKDVKISNAQLFLLLIGFVFGNTAIVNPAAAALQDSWLAFIIAWIGGLALLGIYISISNMNPSKNLIEILIDNFGKILGNITAALYIWYFIHLAALVTRDFGEYMVTVMFPETPILFIISCICITVAYVVKNGLEVIARSNELLTLAIPLLVAAIFLALINQYNFNNLFPFLEKGVKPVLKVSFGVLAFPFGEIVAFLMIFPHLKNRKDLVKTSYFAIIAVGFMLLSVILRDLLVLGPDMLSRVTFPPQISTELIPNITIQPFVAINLLVSGGVKIAVATYAAVIGITQLFNLDDYKPFVLPVVAIVASLSIWVYDNIFDVFQWAAEIWAYYSVPFQILIPLLLVIISWIKKIKTQNISLKEMKE